jgi:uncharacterized protein YpmB
MKKETIFATVFGILFGAVVGAFVLFTTSKGQNVAQTDNASENQAPKITQPVAVVNSKTQLKINEPQNNIISKEKEINIEGLVPKNSLVIIQSSANEVIKEFKEESFKINFPLVHGENVIQVSAYSDNSTPQEESFIVYYIPE